jgi:hypothetical protein
MISFSHPLRRTAIVVVAGVCLVLALGWTGWREELRAQVYTLFSPTISIDICEADQTGVVHIGGKVGEDGRIGELVFVSRGNANQSVGSVMGTGTFEGTTVPGFARPGDNVTVGIRKTGGEGTLMAMCQLATAGRR